MRLPGTFNIINNDLPSAEYLERYRQLKRRQKAAKEGASADDKKGGDGKKGSNNDKNGGNDNAKGDDGDEAQAEVEFTKEQDEKLIEMKLANAQWKAIATETGKDANQLKERFKQIKPADFDKKHQEMMDAAKAEKQQQKKQKKGGGGGGGGGEGGVAGGDADEAKNEEQTQQGGGKKGKKNKGKGPPGPAKEGSDCEDGEEWWEQPDDNWSRNEVSSFTSISYFY